MNDSEPPFTTMNEKPAITTSEVPARSVASIVLAVSAIGLCLLVEAATLLSRHRMSRAINEFDVNVSAVTRFAIGPLFPVLLAIVILAAICRAFAPGRQSTRDKCNLIILLIGAVFLAIYIVGVIVPFISLLNSLS